MTKGTRQLPVRVADIREAIANAKSDIGALTRDQFLADGKTQRAVIECIIVIGEAANSIMRLDPSIESAHAELWQHLKDAYDMRILLTHEISASMHRSSGIPFLTIPQSSFRCSFQ